MNIARERPLGVTILAILNIIGGVVLVILQGVMLTRLGAATTGLAEDGLPVASVVVGLLILTLVTLGSGIAMLLPIPLGWQFGTFCFVYSIARNINALFTIPILFDQAEASGAEAPHSIEFFYAKHGIRILVSLLILAYLMKRNVREFFSVSSAPWKTLVAEALLCVFVGLVVRFLI